MEGEGRLQGRRRQAARGEQLIELLRCEGGDARERLGTPRIE